MYWNHVDARAEIDVLVRRQMHTDLKAAAEVLEQQSASVAATADSRGRLRSFVFEHRKQL